jgi:hypothetical protein
MPPPVEEAARRRGGIGRRWRWGGSFLLRSWLLFESGEVNGEMKSGTEVEVAFGSNSTWSH